MSISRISLLATVVLTGLSLNLNAAPLGIGDPAPTLKVSKWVKGDAVNSLDTNNTYVVEFWATWCGPCKASIPHLTEMAHEFTNVTFIGVDVWEQDGDSKDATVNDFVKKMGSKMDYHVAMDTDDKFMADNWMKAAEQNGIPTAFLIQRGQIIWIGHPMELEKPLTDAASGHFDIDKAKKRADAVERARAFFSKAMMGGNDAELAKEGQELEALDKELGGITPGQTFDAKELIQEAKFSAAMRTYQQAVMSEEDPTEITNLESAARAAAPAKIKFDDLNQQFLSHVAMAKESKKVDPLFKQYIAAVGENGDKDKADKLTKQIQDLNIKNPQLLNEMAWFILTDDSVKQRDLPFATTLAKAAVDNSDNKEPAALDTYAHALYDSGKTSDAIDYEKKAIAAAQDASMKNDLQTTLAKYQATADKSH